MFDTAPYSLADRRAAVLDQLSGGLVVSCQARPGDPLHGPIFMSAMAQAVVSGGAAGVRVEGCADIAAVRAAVRVPVIGLWKDGTTGVYITPTVEHALAVAAAGADVVALDATSRPRRDLVPLADTIRAVHSAGALVMADVATLAEGRVAADAGADLVSTTLAGYTGHPDESSDPGPHLDVVEQLAAAIEVPVVAEGRIASPQQARAAMARGAFAVVVGTAITQPAAITSRFAAALMPSSNTDG